MEKLDTTDRKILAHLDTDARKPLTKVASETRINDDVIRYRIDRLRENGILENCYTIIDTSKLGLLTIRVYFATRNLQPSEEDAFLTTLDEVFNASMLFRRDGQYQFGIISWEPSVYELGTKMETVRKKYGNKLETTDVSLFTELNHHPRGYINEDSGDTVTITNTTSVQVDDKDRAILRELADDARITTTDIARATDIPQRTVADRIRKMEANGIILRYTAAINISAIGYENYFLQIQTQQCQELDEIETFAATHPNCIYTDYTVTGAAMEIEVEFPDKYRLHEFITELRESFPAINRVRYCSTIRYEKISYFPA